MSRELEEYLTVRRSQPLADPKLRAELKEKIGHEIFYETEEDYKNSHHHRDDIKWYPGMTISTAEQLSTAFDERKVRQDQIDFNEEAGGWVYKVAGFEAEIIGKILDPTTLLAGLGLARLAGSAFTMGKNALAWGMGLGPTIEAAQAAALAPLTPYAPAIMEWWPFAKDFIEAFFVEGPGAPTWGGFFGFLSSRIVKEIE